jgi:hypothetical protein
LFFGCIKPKNPMHRQRKVGVSPPLVLTTSCNTHDDNWIKIMILFAKTQCIGQIFPPLAFTLWIVPRPMHQMTTHTHTHTHNTRVWGCPINMTYGELPLEKVLPCWWPSHCSVCKTETMHQLIHFKSKFLNHFAFKLEHDLFLLFWVYFI